MCFDFFDVLCCAVPCVQHRTDNSFLLPLSSLPSLLSLLVAFFLLHLAACDLFLYAVVDWQVGRALAAEYSARLNGAPLPPATLRVSASQRPALFGRLCSHPLFASWQLVHRFACPMSVAIMHLAITALTHAASGLHTTIMYAVDLRALSDEQIRRDKEKTTQTKRNKRIKTKSKYMAATVAADTQSP